MKEWQQNLFPQHGLSRLMGWLASAKFGRLTHFFIKRFVNYYGVNLSEAKISNVSQYESFNDFFTRELKEGARYIAKDESKMICPVDGAISELGKIAHDRLLQAKGHYFTVKALCAGDENLGKAFENGSFMTAYLSPKDYHRFHMPVSGRLLEMIYVPGKLFSVNQSSVAHVPELFARNERVICIFETAIGKVAVIAVGAMIVGSIDMFFHGVVAPQNDDSTITRWAYDDKNMTFEQGDELGCFRLGSTVILLTEADKMTWDERLKPNSPLRLGQVIGSV